MKIKRTVCAFALIGLLANVSGCLSLPNVKEPLPEDTLVLLFSGHAEKKTADEDYPFYADRNFVYLTGLDREGFVFLAEKSGGRVKETVFILPPDAHDERWSGKRRRSPIGSICWPARSSSGLQMRKKRSGTRLCSGFAWRGRKM